MEGKWCICRTNESLDPAYEGRISRPSMKVQSRMRVKEGNVSRLVRLGVRVRHPNDLRYSPMRYSTFERFDAGDVLSSVSIVRPWRLS